MLAASSRREMSKAQLIFWSSTINIVAFLPYQLAVLFTRVDFP